MFFEIFVSRELFEKRDANWNELKWSDLQWDDFVIELRLDLYLYFYF